MPRSSVPGLAWPGLPGTARVTMPALQYQLEQSQWWPPDVVRQQQFRQPQALLSHACGTVPFYRDPSALVSPHGHQYLAANCFSHRQSAGQYTIGRVTVSFF